MRHRSRIKSKHLSFSFPGACIADPEMITCKSNYFTLTLLSNLLHFSLRRETVEILCIESVAVVGSITVRLLLVWKWQKWLNSTLYRRSKGTSSRTYTKSSGHVHQKFSASYNQYSLKNVKRSHVHFVAFCTLNAATPNSIDFQKRVDLFILEFDCWFSGTSSMVPGPIFIEKRQKVTCSFCSEVLDWFCQRCVLTLQIQPCFIFFAQIVTH